MKTQHDDSISGEGFFSRDLEKLQAEGWVRSVLKGGEWLWRQGEAADELAWIEAGTLRVLVGGVAKGSVHAGEWLGEASALIAGERRSADVQAVEATTLWRLHSAQLMALRALDPPRYDVVLTAAVETLARRIEASESELAMRRSGDQAPPAVQRPGLWQRLVRSLGGRGTPPDVSQALWALPGFPALREPTRRRIAEIAEPLFLEPEQALCLQGDPADSMFVVASGSLRVMLASDAGGAIELNRVGPGSLLGTNALVRSGKRSASLVADQSTWVFEIARAQLEAAAPEVRRALRESLLAVLRGQLLGADTRSMQSRGARGTIPLEDAMPAFGRLQSWQSGPAIEVLPELAPPTAHSDEIEPLLELVRSSIIGGDVALETPFGLRRVVYADYTASGRSLRLIEDFLRERVMPLYANTHTEASASGLQTTSFREEARSIVRRSVGGDERDAVIFVGSGATGAVNKLIDILNIRIPPDLDARYGLSQRVPRERRPVVFVGPYEHHSNILPWRHSLAELFIIPLDADGQIDLAELERLLVEYRDRPLRIGSFSAASNVTGIATDVVGVTSLLHRHGALSFWDYAAAGPYVDIRMNPSGEGIDEALAAKDAVFISPHKFIGGPGTPGVLVVKRALVQNTIPTQPGGGTVDFVNWSQSLYTSEVEHREEAGTPAILESIRCGLVFQLKDQIGASTIEQLEHAFVRRAIEAWRANPAIRIVGNPDAERLSITSFMVTYGDRFLHYNYVVALLNDLFGVQARGGCSCAGPYGGLLFGLSPESGATFMKRAEEGWASLKPGWARVNFNYFISEPEFRYIVSAVQLVAAYGWVLMPHYRLDPRSGLWSHRRGNPHRVAQLADLQIDGGRARWGEPYQSLPETALERQLAEGRALLEAALAEPAPEVAAPSLPAEYEASRWFLLPHEVARIQQARLQQGAASARVEIYREALQRGADQGLAPLRRALHLSPEETAQLHLEQERRDV